jgi:hypothetical protein
LACLWLWIAPCSSWTPRTPRTNGLTHRHVPSSPLFSLRLARKWKTTHNDQGYLPGRVPVLQYTLCWRPPDARRRGISQAATPLSAPRYVAGAPCHSSRHTSIPWRHQSRRATSFRLAPCAGDAVLAQGHEGQEWAIRPMSHPSPPGILPLWWGVLSHANVTVIAPSAGYGGNACLPPLHTPSPRARTCPETGKLMDATRRATTGL